MAGMKEYRRPLTGDIAAALTRDHPVLHIIIGPRQTGKTTAARQIAADWRGDVVAAAADAAVPPGPEWIQTHWDDAVRRSTPGRRTLLILDEIQKVRGWSETVKALWDREPARRRLQVLLLGSSALLVQRGMSESLAGRFLLHRCPHWSWAEMKAAFGLSFQEWIYFGGYPGAARFRKDPVAWAGYVNDSLIETVIARDVLQMATVTKPALLRHLFGVAAGYPAQILSYNKMLGQLQDAGNTTTLAHYLGLLADAFLLSGLESWRSGRTFRRGSSPKLIAWNNALVTAVRGESPRVVEADPAWWGRLVENAVGAHLLNHLHGPGHRICYWRTGDLEVDFVVKTPTALWAIEVKSGRTRPAGGLQAFVAGHPGARPLILGKSGVSLESFFGRPPGDTLR